MSSETEKKLALSPKEAEALIKKCNNFFGANMKPFLQCDEYFDRPDCLLQQEDYTIRLRTDNYEEITLSKVAVKGPRIFLEDKSYTRIDIEFSATNREEFLSEAKVKGLVCTAKLEKFRWKYKLGDLKVTLDKYPFIGYIFEAEAFSTEIINKTIQKLGLESKLPIVKNSTELIEEHFAKIGRDPRPNLVATFELED